MGSRSVSASRVIAASPQAIFDILADPSQHPRIDGSGTVKATTGTVPARLSQGAHFGMSMKIGLPYRIENTVVEFDEPRRIAWRHFGGHIWRYELEEVPDGTKVTETFAYGSNPGWPMLALLGVPARNRKAMEATLERLASVVESGADAS